MQTIEERLDRIRKLLSDSDFLSGKGLSNEVNNRVFPYDPMFDLAHLWTHGIGWYRHIASAGQRMSCMRHYFGKILEGYRSETDVSEEMLEKLPLFIDMTIIEFVVDEFECCAREGSEPDEEDIGNAVYCLVNNVPYGGFGEE